MARLVIVSNRVSVPGERMARAGGLAVALRDALRSQGGLWFGSSGEIAETPQEAPRVISAGRVTYVTASLTQADHREYYVSYANSTLWPLLHYRLGLVEYKRSAFKGYLGVNAHLAQMLVPFIRPDDVIWVHDYHFIPFGAELRKLGVANPLGFFLHTPFPSPDVLIALPHHEMIVEALAAYDLVGLQTDRDVHAYMGCIGQIAHGAELGDGSFLAYGRRSRVAALPIGIDTEGYAKQARQAASSPEAFRLKASLAGRDLIIGVDRLDYTKGIPSRFEAIDGLLSDWPAHRRRFNYLQITPHSRAEVAQYRSLRRELEAAAGRVNGKFAEFDWSPIRYVNKSFSRQLLAGFYRLARIGLVTPFRDGMNLVAKEFVASQEPENPGVLVLSRFAGAARELETALLVNPFDVDEIAAALNRGLAMSREERRERWEPMMATLRRNTAASWRESFLAALAEAAATSSATLTAAAAVAGHA
ncbi:MAG: trehalose-6-phosphate synthase [Alphaproteobacteria bacterium]